MKLNFLFVTAHHISFGRVFMIIWNERVEAKGDDGKQCGMVLCAEGVK